MILLTGFLMAFMFLVGMFVGIPIGGIKERNRRIETIGKYYDEDFDPNPHIQYRGKF